MQCSGWHLAPFLSTAGNSRRRQRLIVLHTTRRTCRHPCHTLTHTHTDLTHIQWKNKSGRPSLSTHTCLKTSNSTHAAPSRLAATLTSATWRPPARWRHTRTLGPGRVGGQGGGPWRPCYGCFGRQSRRTRTCRKWCTWSWGGGWRRPDSCSCCESRTARWTRGSGRLARPSPCTEAPTRRGTLQRDGKSIL